jgi:hypothetical protein
VAHAVHLAGGHLCAASNTVTGSCEMVADTITIDEPDA